MALYFPIDESRVRYGSSTTAEWEEKQKEQHAEDTKDKGFFGKRKADKQFQKDMDEKIEKGSAKDADRSVDTFKKVSAENQKRIESGKKPMTTSERDAARDAMNRHMRRHAKHEGAIFEAVRLI